MTSLQRAPRVQTVPHSSVELIDLEHLGCTYLQHGHSDAVQHAIRRNEVNLSMKHQLVLTVPNMRLLK